MILFVDETIILLESTPRLITNCSCMTTSIQHIKNWSGSGQHCDWVRNGSAVVRNQAHIVLRIL